MDVQGCTVVYKEYKSVQRCTRVQKGVQGVKMGVFEGARLIEMGPRSLTWLYTCPPRVGICVQCWYMHKVSNLVKL